DEARLAGGSPKVGETDLAQLFVQVGRGVRIRLPPAASHERTVGRAAADVSLLKATGTSVLKSARRDFSRDFSADGRVSERPARPPANGQRISSHRGLINK